MSDYDRDAVDRAFRAGLSKSVKRLGEIAEAMTPGREMEKAVEAAAKAMYDREYDTDEQPWEKENDVDREIFLRSARTALEAALPFLTPAAAPQGGRVAEIIKALRAYEQADEDGVMVLVSRQACEEAADALALRNSEVVEALRPFANVANCYDDKLDSDDLPVGPFMLNFCREARAALSPLCSGRTGEGGVDERHYANHAVYGSGDAARNCRGAFPLGAPIIRGAGQFWLFPARDQRKLVVV